MCQRDSFIMNSLSDMKWRPCRYKRVSLAGSQRSPREATRGSCASSQLNLSLLRWFGHLISMPLSCLGISGTSNWEETPGRASVRWRDYISHPTLDHLGISPEDLEEVRRENNVLAAELSLWSLQRKKRDDGWLLLKKEKKKYIYTVHEQIPLPSWMKNPPTTPFFVHTLELWTAPSEV